MPGQRRGNAVAVALQRGEAFGVFIGQGGRALGKRMMRGAAQRARTSLAQRPAFLFVGADFRPQRLRFPQSVHAFPQQGEFRVFLLHGEGQRLRVPGEAFGAGKVFSARRGGVEGLVQRPEPGGKRVAFGPERGHVPAVQKRGKGAARRRQPVRSLGQRLAERLFRTAESGKRRFLFLKVEREFVQREALGFEGFLVLFQAADARFQRAHRFGKSGVGGRGFLFPGNARKRGFRVVFASFRVALLLAAKFQRAAAGVEFQIQIVQITASGVDFGVRGAHALPEIPRLFHGVLFGGKCRFGGGKSGRCLLFLFGKAGGFFLQRGELFLIAALLLAPDAQRFERRKNPGRPFGALQLFALRRKGLPVEQKRFPLGVQGLFLLVEGLGLLNARHVVIERLLAARQRFARCVKPFPLAFKRRFLVFGQKLLRVQPVFEVVEFFLFLAAALLRLP